MAKPTPYHNSAIRPSSSHAFGMAKSFTISYAVKNTHAGGSNVTPTLSCKLFRFYAFLTRHYFYVNPMGVFWGSLKLMREFYKNSYFLKYILVSKQNIFTHARTHEMAAQLTGQSQSNTSTSQLNTGRRYALTETDFFYIARLKNSSTSYIQINIV